MDYVTMELRPLIQSCYVFIHMKNNIEIENYQHIKIIIKHKTLVIEIINKCYNILIPSTISLRPQSISQLEIFEKWIVFRVQTSPSNESFGTFTCELIFNRKNNNSEIQEAEIEDEFIETSNIWQMKLPPKDMILWLLCTCCKNIISNTSNNVSFYKILPLPRDITWNGANPNDWFCCLHSGHDMSDTCKTLFNPTERDLYYGSHFYILNKNILSPNLKINNLDILCERCLAVIGVCDSNSDNYDENSLKFWSYCIDYEIIDSASTVSTYPSFDVVKFNTPLIDFKLILKYYMDMSNNRYNYNDQIEKNGICFYANEQNQLQFLILRIIEKNLIFLADCGIDEVSGDVNIKKNKITKVLFNCQNIYNSEATSNGDLKLCQISLQSITAGLEYLVASSKRIPLIYRTVGEYCVSYIL